MEATTKTDLSIKGIIKLLMDGKTWVMNTRDVSYVIDYANMTYPDLKIDAQINYEPGKTKLSKR